MLDLQSLIEAIYAPWGGNGTAMAADIGELPVTVNQWRHRRFVPPEYWQTIIEKSVERGHELGPDVFFAMARASKEARQPAQAAA